MGLGNLGGERTVLYFDYDVLCVCQTCNIIYKKGEFYCM